MFNATTPLLKFKFVNTDFVLSDFPTIKIAFSQMGNVIFSKEKDEITVIDDKHCEIKLSQEEINKFNTAFNIQLQFRCKDLSGNVIASNIIEFDLRACLDEGIL